MNALAVSSDLVEFVSKYWLDILTTALGLAYIILEYRASIWLWAVGFVMQSFGIVLYYQKGLYADCGMEFYYLAMTIYGFITWKFVKSKKTTSELPITHFNRKMILPWICITIAVWGLIYWLLVTRTDSNVPLADSFTTALSVVGIWALARKYLEQWLIWIVIDIVSCALYFYKGIPFKASLYALYVVIAVFGYIRWKKVMKQNVGTEVDDNAIIS